MPVSITILPEPTDACYALELLATQDDGGEVYVCAACGYKRVFYWADLDKSHTAASPTGSTHRHCLTTRPPELARADGLLMDVAPAAGPLTSPDAPPGWTPRRDVVRRGIVGGRFAVEITSVEVYGSPWSDEGGSCRIRLP